MVHGLHIRPTNVNRDKGSQTNRAASSRQTSRDRGYPQTNKDIGSRNKSLTDTGPGVNKDDSPSVRELIRNRKRYLPEGNADANDPTTPPIKMSRVILDQVDDTFSLLDEEGPSVGTELAE